MKTNSNILNFSELSDDYLEIQRRLMTQKEEKEKDSLWEKSNIDKIQINSVNGLPYSTEDSEEIEIKEEENVTSDIIKHILDFDSPLKEISNQSAEVKTVEDIVQVREELTQWTTKIASLPEQSDNREAVADYRKVSPTLFEKDNCFYVLNKAYLREHMGMAYFDKRFGIAEDETTLFTERFIIPVYDFNGKVAGFVGYDNISGVKYINSKNPGYRRGKILLGAQNFLEYLQHRYVIIVEGIFDYYSLRNHGLPVWSTLGVLLTRFQMEYLKYFDRVIVIGDGDATGDKLVSRLRKWTSYDFILFSKSPDELKAKIEEEKPLDTNWSDYYEDDGDYEDKIKDIDDYVKTKGVDKVVESINKLLKSPKGLTVILNKD